MVNRVTDRDVQLNALGEIAISRTRIPLVVRLGGTSIPVARLDEEKKKLTTDKIRSHE